MCQFDHLNTFNNSQENSVLAQGTLLYMTVKSVLISEVIRCVYKIIISNMRYIYLCVLLNNKKNLPIFFTGYYKQTISNGDEVSTVGIVARNRDTFILGSSPSEV